MTVKLLLEESRSLCVLFLVLAFSINLNLPSTNNRVMHAAGVQQLLEQGRSITRDIADGEVHSFSFDVKVGEFLHVFVRQLGVNVAVRLIAPEGTRVIEADIPRSTEEPEWLVSVARVAGRYSVEVRTVDRGAVAGKYEIKLDELRQQTANDDSLLAAQTAFSDGSRMFNEKNYKGAIQKYEQALTQYRQAGTNVEQAVMLNCLARSNASLFDYQAAIARFNDALAIYRNIGDLSGEATTLHGLGSAYVSFGQYQEGISNLERAVEARQKTGYRAGQAATLRGLGIGFSMWGRQEIAIDYFEKSLAIYREVKDRAEQGRSLNAIGLAYNYQGKTEKAVEYYVQALAISRELKDRSGESRALTNLGKAYTDLDRHEKSIEYSEQALTVLRELNDRPLQGTALNNIGASYNHLSRYEKAIPYLEQALTVSRETKDQSTEGRALTNLGNAYSLLGLPEKAVSYYEQALELRKRIQDRKGEGLTLGNLANAYNRQGQYQRAIEVLAQALAIQREVKDRKAEGYTQNDLGNAYSNLAQYQKAIEHYNQGLAISREVKNRTAEGDSLWGLGKTNDSLGQYEKAIDYYQQSLRVSRETKDQANEGRTLHSLSSVWERQHNNAIAIIYGKQAVKAFQAVRVNLRSLDPESRFSFLKSHEDAYRKLANLLISEGRLAEAERVLELLKEEEFNRILRNSPMEPDIALTKSETEAVRLSDQLAQLASERGALLDKVAHKTATDKDRQRLNLIESAISEANRKIKVILVEVSKASDNEELITHQSRSMMQTLRKLGAGTVALYTVVTNDKGWVILTTPDFRRAYPINTVELNKTISDFRLRLMSASEDPVPLGQKLYKSLFQQKSDAGATLAADLKAYKAKTLMWSLDGAIRYLPIAALHDGKGYLVESYSNVVFTTASLTRLLDSSASKWRAIGLGVSKQHQNFIALTFVPAELRSIIREEGAANSAGVLPGIIRLDEQFTLQTMTEGLREGYPVVHIASHFVFLPGREKLSYLLLGDGSTLSLDEMEQSPGIFERVELLTLSACETALGANGKEVESLAFVAQDLGAKAVVASLWPVTDEGTQVLMREFYRLKKANPKWSKIDALRHAQISLLRGTKTGTRQIPKNSLQTRRNEEAKAPFAHPRYWAPFILIGNWK